MKANAVPEGWKNRPEYTLGEAVTVWAFAMYDRPMNLAARECGAWRRQYSAAETDLRESGYLQQNNWTEEADPPGPIGCGDPWIDGPVQHAPTIVQKTREWFKGPDLAAFARERGQPGLFGFDEERTEATAEWGFEYDTELLEAVRWVVRTYWEGKDPSSGPTKELVVEKLIDLHGLSERAAKAVDQVTRPDEKRRKGV